jgi:apolipoprotein N-acyltransferase
MAPAELATASEFRDPRRIAAALLAAVALAVVTATPWLRQELVPLAIGSVAAGLLLVRQIRGWVGELAALLTAILSLSIAFHWAPKVLAHAMDSSEQIGLAFTVPIVIWDSLRLVAPFWFAARAVRDPRNAWLPAALVAVVAEAALPSVFPWKLGYTMVAWPVAVQAVDLFGAEWATFVLFANAGAVIALLGALLVAVGRGHLIDAAAPAGDSTVPSPRVWTPAGVAALAVVACNAAYGAWALSAWSGTIAAAPTLRVGLVQVDPSEEEAIYELQQLTREACAAGAFDLVCWPECSGGSYEHCLANFADTDLLERHSRDPRWGIRPLEAPTCPLLFGGQIYEGLAEKPQELYQSAILMDRSESLAGVYHKRHLMPFGEYVPWAEQFPELRLYFPMAENYSLGRDATVLESGSARLGVLLCYEDMVAPAAASLVRNSANVLVSLINGAFFTEPLTLAQHRLLAQLRAVENRRAFMRCAATGETCVVSPLGTISARLPIHTPDVLAVEVPLIDSLTPATRFWPAFPVLCAAVVGAGLLRHRRAARAARA